MFRRINSSPVLFAQPLKIKNRQWFRSFKNIAKQMGNLLRDRSMLTFRSSLKLPIKSVGKVLDVQDRHTFTPIFLHYGGTRSMESTQLSATVNSGSRSAWACGLDPTRDRFEGIPLPP